MKLFRLLLLLPCMIYAGDNGLTRINRSSLHVAHEIGKMALYHNGTSFIAKQNGVKTEIGSESLDDALRNVNARNLAAFTKAGKILVNRTNDGSLMLRHQVDGKGGAAFGAWIGVWVGKGVVHIAAQGALMAVSAGVAAVTLNPAIGTAFYYGSAATVATTVEYASNVAAIGCGIIGATITGPV